MRFGFDYSVGMVIGFDVKFEDQVLMLYFAFFQVMVAWGTVKDWEIGL